MKKLIISVLVPILIILGGCSYQGKGTELSDTQFIMDTVCTIRAGGCEESVLTEAVGAAFDRIYEISALTDYYSASSEVSAINAAEKNQPVMVSDDTLNILSEALKVCEASKGAFDITVAPLKDIWGFNEGDHAPPADADILSALKNTGYDKIHLDLDAKSVTKASAHTKIDLGGCAKGYAADCALEVLKGYGVSYSVIDLGGNILTYGENPSTKDKSWRIGIQKPFSKSGDFSETVTVFDSAVVTSGTYQRYFEWDGKRYHHILDPKTGYPADSGAASMSIICSSALTADCLSTAAMVLGEEKGKNLASSFNAELIALYEE